MSNRRGCVLAAVAGVLWYLSFPPVGWGILSVLAPALLTLSLQGSRRLRDDLVRGYAFGVVFYLPAMWWLQQVHPGVLVLAFLLQMLHVTYLGPMLGHVLRRWPRAPRFLLVPVLWGACDLVRGWGPYGFPWFQPSMALDPSSLPPVQVADLVGGTGLSLMVLCVAGSLVDLWRAQRARGAWAAAVAGLLVSAILWGGAWMYGSWRLAQLPLQPGPTVLVVQANVPQEEREEVAPGGREAPSEDLLHRRLVQILDQHLTLSLAQAHLAPDLVIWGETTYLYDLARSRVDPRTGERVRDAERIRDLVEQMGASFLVGGFRQEYGEAPGSGPRIHNTAYFFDRAWDRELCYLADAGHKRHLVPGGEFIPLHHLPGVRAFARWVSGADLPDLTPGETPVRFRLPTARGEVPFGVFICYETFFPDLLLDLVRAEPAAPGAPAWPGAAFLVNLSNEGWFGASAELDQHLRTAQLRAIEMRRSVVRGTNTGISALIDPLGRIQSRLQDASGRDRDVVGVLVDRVPLTQAGSPFVRLGCWISLPLLAGGLLLWVWPRRARRGLEGQSPGGRPASQATTVASGP